MLRTFAPIVCTPFVALCSPVDSFAPIAWSDAWPDVEPAAAAVAVADVAPPPAAKSETPASVLAWRQNYYAFRHARGRVLAGRSADAVPYIVGPFAPYVQARLAEIARTDRRFADVLALATGAGVTPSAEPAAVEVPAAMTSTEWAIIVDRVAVRNALRRVVEAIPNAGQRVKLRDGRSVPNPGKRLRLELAGESLRVRALDCGWIAPADADRVQVDRGGASVAIASEILLRIFELSEHDDTLSLSVEGHVLHVRGSDAHYQLFTLDPEKAIDVEPPAAARLKPAAWMTRTLELAAVATDDAVETPGRVARLELDGLLRDYPRANRRKLAWRMLRATAAGDAAGFAARDHLLAAMGPAKLRAWIDGQLGGIVPADAFAPG